MKAFTRRKRGRIWAEFTYLEARLLVSLSGQVSSLLTDRHPTDTADRDPLADLVGTSGPLNAPEDPVLRRLLPDAYRDDAEDATEFRRLTERGLSEAKLRNAESMVGSLVASGLDLDAEEGPPIEVELDDSEALAWMRALTDIRLALSVRLGIENEYDADRVAHSEDEHAVAMYDIYEWLGFVQETLVTAAT